MRAFLCACAACAVFAGCSQLPRFGVYKLDINQGNYITQDQVEKIKVGQTRLQVRQVLGTPLLSDAFHANRWDYVYLFERQGKLIEQTRLTIYFVDEKVARWENGELPPSQVEQARAAEGDALLDKSLSLAPKTGETNWLEDLLRKLGWWQ